jgi:hypothetical protein
MESRKKERRSVNGRSAREGRRMRTCFGGVEEILGGREGLVGRIQGRATLELVITCNRVSKPATCPERGEKEEIM